MLKEPVKTTCFLSSRFKRFRIRESERPLPSIRFLFHRHAGFLFPVRGEDLKMMNPCREWMVAGPDDLFFPSQLDHRYPLARRVAADNRIAIGESL